MTATSGLDGFIKHVTQKHGCSYEQVPGTVYAICYAEPTVVASVSSDYPWEEDPARPGRMRTREPIAHYVGWTYRRDPSLRVAEHHAVGTRFQVTLIDGASQIDEHDLKLEGVCRYCEIPFRDSLDQRRLI